MKLVIIGHQHSDFGMPKGVVFTGHVPNNDLATFYSGAKVLVYPSYYEGFGLPIIYAFSCETPVVTSNLGSMAEVGSNASVLVDPKSVNSIAEGILEALQNRNVLIKRGLKEASKYSWIETAKKTLKIYGEGV